MVIADTGARSLCTVLTPFTQGPQKPETIYEGFTAKIFANRGYNLANLYEFPSHSPDAQGLPTPKPAKPRGWAWVLAALAPILAAAVYLFGFAADQYASTAAFSVRSDDNAQALLLGGLSGVSGGSYTEAAMAADYLKSLNLVSELDGPVGLVATGDPLYPPLSGAEDWVNRWQNLTSARLDSRTGIVTFQVRAFDPASAQRLTQQALDQTAQMIAGLSFQMQSETTRLARETYQNASSATARARADLTAFQVATQIASPELEVEVQAGLLSQLQGQLAEASVALALLSQTTGANDARMAQAQGRVDALTALIKAEQAKIRGGTRGAEAAAQFQALRAELDYALAAETAARASYDAALVSAQKRSFYLAIHLPPQLPQSAEFPRRWHIMGTVAMLSVLGIGCLYLIISGLRRP